MNCPESMLGTGHQDVSDAYAALLLYLASSAWAQSPCSEPKTTP
jgi:hypothetical protein